MTVSVLYSRADLNLCTWSYSVSLRGALPCGRSLLIAHRCLRLLSLWLATTMLRSSPQRRAGLPGHRSNEFAIHHSFCDIDLPCAIASSSATMYGIPHVERLDRLRISGSTSGSRWPRRPRLARPPFNLLTEMVLRLGESRLLIAIVHVFDPTFFARAVD